MQGTGNGIGMGQERETGMGVKHYKASTVINH